jgi:hypothetical protein
MSATIRVLGVTAECDSAYDLFLAAVGYEARARFVVESLHPRAFARLGLAFTHDKVLDFDLNRRALTEHGYEITEQDDENVAPWLLDRVLSLPPNRGTVRLGVDISSLTRKRIAIAFDVLRQSAALLGRSVSTDWYYSVARFSAPPRRFVPNAIAGPVLPAFAGWSIEPERPLVAVVGLGYEEDRALGAVEHVQASETWALRPLSHDPRYDAAVARANSRLLEAIRPRRVVAYPVERPIDCVGVLESLVYGIIRNENAVILPFGPKILMLCSLLVAHIHPAVAVWRVSAGGAEEPVNRRPSGRISCLRVEFSPTKNGLELDGPTGPQPEVSGPNAQGGSNAEIGIAEE